MRQMKQGLQVTAILFIEICVSDSRPKPESDQHSVSGIWPLGSRRNQKTVGYIKKTCSLYLAKLTLD